MEWSAQVNIYCERMDPGFWAEPLNAGSNLVFILAALWAWQRAGHEGSRGPATYLLILLTLAVGVGSFLFHTFATGWAGVADVLPIMLFIVCYMVVALSLMAGSSRLHILIFTLGAIAFLSATGWLIDKAALTLDGSEGYLPALLAMILISAGAGLRGHPVFSWYLAATLLFALSLFLRSLDMALCPAWPYGTHTFWHLLNGAVIALLLQALVRNTRKASTP
ncbi:MAG: ceramidase domain-containing protein [Sulfitobacter sp.]|nr:ceramidase domain-containing protein [Sulfitobacter sp.]